MRRYPTKSCLFKLLATNLSTANTIKRDSTFKIYCLHWVDEQPDLVVSLIVFFIVVFFIFYKFKNTVSTLLCKSLNVLCLLQAVFVLHDYCFFFPEIRLYIVEPNNFSALSGMWYILGSLD